MVLNALEDQFLVDANTLVYQWHCAAAQVTGWDDKEELFDYHRGQAHHAYNVIGKKMLPWYKHWQTEEKTLAQLWKEFKEAEKDPVFAEYLRKRRKKLGDDIERDKQREALYEERAKQAAEELKQREEAVRKRRERQHARLRH